MLLTYPFDAQAQASQKKFFEIKYRIPPSGVESSCLHAERISTRPSDARADQRFFFHTECWRVKIDKLGYRHKVFYLSIYDHNQRFLVLQLRKYS